MLDLDDFGTLCCGISDDWLCEHLDVNPRTLRRWKSGHTEAPKAVRLLLRYINYGELSAIGGKDWDGFTLNAKFHTLNVPLFHRPFEAGQIKAMFFTTQDAWTNRADLKTVQAELAEVKAELAAEKEKAAYYRQQLKEAGFRYRLHQNGC